MTVQEVSELGNTETMEELLTAFPMSADSPTGWRRVPLHWACRNGHGALVQLLLDRGADPAIGDSEGWTPLHWAVNNRHPQCVQPLLHHYPAAGSFRTRAPPPLQLLNNPLAELLCDRAVPDSETVASHVEWFKQHSRVWHGHDHGDVWDSAEKGDILGILLCLQPNRPPPTARGAHKRTPLHWACICGHAVAAAFLLPFFEEAQGQVDVQDIHGNTPLHWAVNNSHVKCIEAILQHPKLATEWMDVRNLEGQAPPQLAKSTEVALLLGRSGAQGGGSTSSSPLYPLSPLSPLSPSSRPPAEWGDWTTAQQTFTFGHLRSLFTQYHTEEQAKHIRTLLGLEKWRPEGHQWLFPQQRQRVRTLFLLWTRLHFVPEDLLWEVCSFLRNE